MADQRNDLQTQVRSFLTISRASMSPPPSSKQSSPSPSKPVAPMTPPPLDSPKTSSSQWDMISAFRKRYPRKADASEAEIYQYLAAPDRFRAAFPEHANLGDENIRHNVNRDWAVSIKKRTADFDKGNAPEPYWGFMPTHLWKEAVEGVSQLASGTYGLAKDVLSDKPISETYQKNVVVPLEEEMKKSGELWQQGRKSEAVGHYIASYLPFLGPWAAELGEQVGKGDVGGALAKAGAQMITGKAVESSGDILKKSARKGLLYASGAGDTALDRAARKMEAGNKEKQAAYAEKVSDLTEENKVALTGARHAHEGEMSDIDAKNERARSEYQTSVERVRQSNTQAKADVERGMSSDKAAQQLAVTLSDELPEIEKVETEKARAAYPKIEGTVDPADLREDLQKSVDEKLKGTGRVPSSLKRILDETAPKEGRSEGPTVMGKTLNLENPEDAAAYQKFKESGAFSPEEISSIEGEEQKPISFDDLHGMYSEIGREMYQRDLPGDEKATLADAYAKIGERMKKMAEAERKSTQFEAAQRGWRRLVNTFRNTDPAARGGSPIAKALQTRDPVTGKLRPDYVRKILSDKKANAVAQELLGRHDSTEPLQESLKMLAEHESTAKTAPKIVSLKPEPEPPREKSAPKSVPTGIKGLPKAPELESLDVAKWRDEQLEKYGAELQKIRPYNLMPWRMPFTIAGQLISMMLRNPDFRRSVAEAGRMSPTPGAMSPTPSPIGAPLGRSMAPPPAPLP